MNICAKKILVTLISGDDVIELIENKCVFKIVESYQSCNAFREDISWTRIKHIRCQ